MKLRNLALAPVALLLIAGCTTSETLTAAQAPVAATSMPSSNPAEYKLGVGDRVRIDTFGETGLSGEFLVSTGGKIIFPLVGDVDASGKTATEVAAAITDGLKKGYLTEPRVTVQVLSFRNFYVLGEVNRPGAFPYQPGMTVMNAVATAGGFTYRANKKYVYLKNEDQPAEVRTPLNAATAVQPGATVRIAERYF